MPRRVKHFRVFVSTSPGGLSVYKTACNKKIRTVYGAGKGVDGKYTTHRVSEVSCAPCQRIMNQTSEERERDKQAARERFIQLATMSDYSRAMKNLWRRIAVDMSRHDADVARDALLQGDLDDAAKELVDRVCQMAMTAYFMENTKSRGTRLWVFDQVGVETKSRADDGLAFVRCRFCRAELLQGLMGVDHTTSRATTMEGTVADHTVMCAVEYLRSHDRPGNA